MESSEVERSAIELGIQNQICKIAPDEEAKRLYFSLLHHFTTSKGNPLWWWEHFRDEFHTSSRCWRDGKAYQRILDIVPDPDEQIWFIPGENNPPFPVYLTSSRIAQQVIGNSYGFEYYIIDRDLKWLLCENHHEVVVGIGDPVASRLTNLEQGK